MSRRSSILTAGCSGAAPAGAMPAGASPRVPPRAARRPEAPAAKGPPNAFRSRKDGNDGGPLDLASMKITGASPGHVSSRRGPVPTLHRHQRWQPRDLFDTNNDQRYEYGQYIFFAAGKLRGIWSTARQHIIDRTVPTSRTAQRVPPGDPTPKIHSPGPTDSGGVLPSPMPERACTRSRTSSRTRSTIALSHAGWDTGSLSRAMPRRFHLPVSFHFADDRSVPASRMDRATRAGVATWSREGWQDATHRRSPAQGDHLRRPVIVVDRQKNRTISTKRTPSPRRRRAMYDPSSRRTSRHRMVLGTRRGSRTPWRRGPRPSRSPVEPAHRSASWAAR
jgi:hypothetical protein